MKVKKGSREKVIIGITGGIGSGKTLICNKLNKKGFKVFYADAIAKTMYTSNKALHKSLVKEFGEGILNYQGKISLSKLRNLLFKNKKNYERVNKIVHPIVINYINAQAKKSIYDVVLIESAILFESKFDKDMDYVIMIYADKKTRIKRIMERDGASRSEVENIMKYQIDEKKKIELSDFVLVNNKSELELNAQIDFLGKLLKSLTKRKELLQTDPI
ncbi:dephospho-CoA kinase [soil metagenome]